MNLSDLTRNACMLRGPLAKKGYMRWWHSFSGVQPDTGDTRTFFIEFFVMNPGLGGNQPILGQHPYYKKRGMRPSYVMIEAGAFPDAEGEGGRQLHAFYPISALKTTLNPLVMQVSDSQTGHCLYSEDKLTGFVEVSRAEARHRSLMTDSGSMEWDLEVRKAVSCHTGLRAGRFFQLLNALDSYWHGEGIRSFFRGSVTLDGVSYDIIPELSYGYADKHWGRSFNRPWFQFACGKLSSQRTGGALRHSVLAMSGFCPRFLWFPLRGRLMLQLTYMGEDFTFSRCKWETKETGKRFIWHILAKSKSAVVKVSGSSAKAEMLQLQYESPEGKKSKIPLLAGSAGVGTIQLYRKVSGARELMDTLKLDNALCFYQKEALDRPQVPEA